MRSGCLRDNIQKVLLPWGQFFDQKPLSQIRRSTSSRLQDSLNPHSFGGFGLKRGAPSSPTAVIDRECGGGVACGTGRGPPSRSHRDWCRPCRSRRCHHPNPINRVSPAPPPNPDPELPDPLSYGGSLQNGPQARRDEQGGTEVLHECCNQGCFGSGGHSATSIVGLGFWYCCHGCHGKTAIFLACE